MLVLLKIVYGRGPGVGCGGEGRPGETGVLSAYIIEVYKDVQKIWGGFFSSNYKYGCSMQARMINMDMYVCIYTTSPPRRDYVIFRLKIIMSQK